MAKPLIVYYSRTGKTRLVAEKLAAILDADIEELVERKSRRGARAWFGGIKDVLLKRPGELTSRHGTEGRSLILLGMPVWASSPPPAVRAYLGAANLASANVAAFCTHDGGGGKRLFATLAEILPRGLVESLEVKKPRPDDPRLDAALRDWAGRVKAIAAS